MAILNIGQFNIFYYIAVTLLCYCVFSSLYSIKSNLLFKIKRFYYALWFLLYAIMINHLNYDVFPEKEIFGLPVIIGLPLVLFIVGMIVAVLIDTFIISGTGFKEFSIFGAKFIKAEALENIEIQTKYVQLLSKKIEAEHICLQQLENYMDKIIKKLNVEGLDFPIEYAELLKLYADNQRMIIIHLLFLRKAYTHCSYLTYQYMGIMTHF